MSNAPLVLPPSGAASGAPSLAEMLACHVPASAPAQLPAGGTDQVAPVGHTDSILPGAPGPAPDILADTMPDAALGAAPVRAALPVPLLLVHAGLSEGALIQTWMQNVLKGSSPYVARFQDSVLELLQYHQPHAVIIQFDPHCLDAAAALAAQLQTLYPQLPRLAIGRSKYPQCMLAALRTGVRDFLDIDAAIDTAQQAVQQLIKHAPTTGLHAPRAAYTAIVSARAGMGTSLLAAHLAWHLQTRLSAAQPASPGAAASATDPESLSSLLIELGSPGGDCAIYLNTPGEFTFTDAITQQRRLDRRMAQSALSRHSSGLRLLTLAHQAQLPTSREVDALLKRLGQYFKHIVLDLGATHSPQLFSDVLPDASDIWVVCDQSIASVVWTAELLQQFDALQIERGRLRLIVSRHDRALELSAEQISRQLQLPLLAQIPERRRELSQAVNQGLLLAPQQKREPYVQAIDKLVTGLLADHHSDIAPTTPAATSALAQLLQRLRRN